jgi:release factor glutamine methyltransferase
VTTLPATVGSALAWACEHGVERLDAQLLVAKVLHRPRTWVIAHDDAALTGAHAQALAAALARRAAGEPLAYLLGEREFRGLTLRVTPDVLVPRPDTETLVDWALELLAGLAAPRVIDLGTGSGAIALAVKHACPQAEVHASDASQAALSVARANGQALGLHVTWHAGPWWQAAPAGLFDLALSNPPYVAAGDRHLAALRHEPAMALTPAGDRGDGLADIQRIASGAPPRLRLGGWLLLEHGAEQGPAVRRLLQSCDLADVRTQADLAGLARVTGGRRSR